MSDLTPEQEAIQEACNKLDTAIKEILKKPTNNKESANGACTAGLKKIRANVRVMTETYPLEELRLYYGSRRIRDIAAWLKEEEQQ